MQGGCIHSEDPGGPELHKPELVIRSTTNRKPDHVDIPRPSQASPRFIAADRWRCASGVHVHHLLLARTHSSRLLRGHRAADVPILLGDGEPEERARPRSLANSLFLQHRGGGIRASRRTRSGSNADWCTRAEARDLTLTTLRFFWNAPQGPEELRALPATRASSTTSSTWRLASGIGMSSCPAWRHPPDGRPFREPILRPRRAAEREIRNLAQKIYARADMAFLPQRRACRDLDGLGIRAGADLRPTGPGSTKGCSSTSWRWVSNLSRPGQSLGAVDRAISELLRGEGSTRRVAFAPLMPWSVQPDLHGLSRIRDARDARGRLSTISKTAAARPTPTGLIALPIRCNGRLIQGACGDWPRATDRGTSAFPTGARRVLRTVIARADRSVSRTDAMTDSHAVGGARVTAFRSGDRHPGGGGTERSGQDLRSLRIPRRVSTLSFDMTCVSWNRLGRSAAAAGSRLTISASTRDRSCCRLPITGTTSSGGTCGRCPRSGSGLKRAGYQPGAGSADQRIFTTRLSFDTPRLVERFDGDPIGHALVQRSQILLQGRGIAEFVRPKLVGLRQPIGASAEPDIVADRPGTFAQRMVASRWS